MDSLFQKIVSKLDHKQFSVACKSTVQALVYFLHTILESLDRGENYIRVFFADFSKGFDLVDHNVLISELELPGVRICSRNWKGAFLTSRPRRVTINGIVSTPVFPHGGIPQGTRLAPLLFGVLANRLVSDWPYRVKYVDDTTVYEAIPRCSPSYLPYVASDFCHFASERGMRLNPKRCRELIINFLQFQPAPVSELQLMGFAIRRVDSYNSSVLRLDQPNYYAYFLFEGKHLFNVHET